jgi:two-component system, OmpR family, phosphate regulon sensor histidine kinase PhoR
MKKLKGVTGLMVITLIGIIGFQGWWLKNNYDREKKALEISTNVKFQEAVRGLQAMKLKLIDPNFVDSPRGKMKFFIKEGVEAAHHPQVKFRTRPEMVTMVNTIKTKLKDSLRKDQAVGGAMIISMNEASAMRRSTDSLPEHFEKRLEIKGGDIFRYLYGIDSLQDSLKLPEIISAYKTSLVQEKITVPFTIVKMDSVCCEDEEFSDMSKATVGFARPVTYKMELGNPFSYILKKLTLPILFSVFLVGISVLSFLLLYRNLLRQQKLAAIKNEFISNITHELKTPIATVGVAIEALKNFNAIDNPQKTREYLDISSNELQRLSLLVDKVLKLSMFEKKEIDLKYEQLNLKDLVDEVVSSMRLQIEKYHARVTVTAEGDVNLQGDRLHLLSVVFNLLDNSLKYGKENPSVSIELKESGEKVEWNIADNGIGIPTEYKDKVFEKFFRVPAGNTHNAKGYGLGLSYVAHVIQKHNGDISVDSQPDWGTKFTISLPKQV